MYSLIVPVYLNEGSIGELVEALDGLRAALDSPLEVIFVVDGSPDASYTELKRRLPHAGFTSQLISHSRNFGSFAAIRTGFIAARGDYFAVMAADLQEPPELAGEFFRQLALGQHDVLIGTRESRSDPWSTRMASKVFWSAYRRLINRNIPSGGVDVFACNREFRDQLIALGESNSSLIGLLFWLGFRRGTIRYERQLRRHGKSAWTLRRKLKYMIDSVFSFSDLPIRILLLLGVFGISIAILFGLVIVLLRLTGGPVVPGYAATMITVLLFGGLNALGLGIVGAYVWRAFANTQNRPLAVVMKNEEFPGATR
ncbi:glycosyltransferase family 2 protein [Tahibacter sp.]|uniref:glycosyltransferase family 2 protein n=1 Tax=Tahibacter sp. TaxID=2056211 RepID=UPI0028C39F57|nr:glycosyltransferase family 2 protein [Tahibacter sp.]